jgi:hypothetical protein
VSDEPPSTDETLTGQVEVLLAGLDEADPAAHADAFEAVDAAILAELQRLETL